MKQNKLLSLLTKVILIPIVVSLVIDKNLTAFGQNNLPIKKAPNNYPAIFQLVTPLKDNPKKLVLRDVVVLLLANNTEIKNAYLDRIIQRGELAVAEDKFRPDFTPTLSVSANKLGDITNTNSSLDAKVVMKIPTGAVSLHLHGVDDV